MSPLAVLTRCTAPGRHRTAPSPGGLPPVVSLLRKVTPSLLLSLVAQLCGLLDPIDCSPPGSSVHGGLQARILEWVAIFFSRRCSQPRDRTQVSCIAGRFFTKLAMREAEGYHGAPLMERGLKSSVRCCREHCKVHWGLRGDGLITGTITFGK